MNAHTPRLSDRAVRITVVAAALLLFSLHLGQGYLQISRARHTLSALGTTLVESAAVAAASPLWVLSENTLEDLLRSVGTHEAVQYVVLYDQDRPALAYDREHGLQGNLDATEPLQLQRPAAFDRFSQEIVFDGERIGAVEVSLDNARLWERILLVVGSSMVFLLGELTVIFLALRVRTARLREHTLNEERDELEWEVQRRQALEEQLRHAAYYDPLSGLPSRRAVGREVKLPEIGPGSDLNRVVFLISMDNLPELSAVLDTKLVDELIRTFADRLREQLDFSSAVALRGRGFRFFVVAVVAGEAGARELALRVRESFRIPVPIGSRAFRLRVRVGMTELAPDEEFDSARKRAEVAARSVRALGDAAQIGRYSERDESVAARRVQLETAMSGGDFLRELSVVYQPIVDLNEGRAVGYEALVRWHHPVYGVVSPAEFIPLAEENGLILDVGWYVLQEGIAMATYLQRQRRGGDVPFVSINVSPVQLFQDQFPELIVGELSRCGIPTSGIKLEITETSIEDSQDTFWRAAEAFKQAGMAIAIDDFGSGSSAFRRLSEFTFDTLKIDQYFVRGMQPERSLPIIWAINNLAEATGMHAVVEGIETEDDADLVRRAGGRLAQGYLYGRPAPATTLFGDYE